MCFKKMNIDNIGFSNVKIIVYIEFCSVVSIKFLLKEYGRRGNGNKIIVKVFMEVLLKLSREVVRI